MWKLLFVTTVCLAQSLVSQSDRTPKTVEEVMDKINSNCIMLFSKSFCPYCNIAKKIFHDIGAEYGVIELDKHPNGISMLDVLEDMTGGRKVPLVFISGQFIGEPSDTMTTDGSLLKSINLCKEMQ